YAQVKTKTGNITAGVADEALRAMAIDEIGLDDKDRKLLKVIAQHYKGGPVGIETLAATLNEEMDTIVDVIEPYLLKIGFLKRTPRGRELTQTAGEHLKVLPAAKETQPKLY
ncbi:MAG TPA: Holliday junction branch migration DNA helicase RuvB, partial [Candidatus Omnitrophica bacterium]|nr:Holliday junction branch migration DNA helicase RuvB [Candidatus Omnitrophota bacterium]